MNKISNLKIGLTIGGFKKFYSIEDSFLKMKQIGYDAVDYPLCIDWNKENPLFDSDDYIEEFKSIRQKADIANIKINQTHGFFPTEKRDLDWMIKTYKRQIHATKILGAKYIVIHPLITEYEYKYKEEVFEKNIEFFNAILPFLIEYDITACLENLWEFDRNSHYIVRTNTSTPKDLLELLGRLNNDHFGICLDFGHMQNVGVDIGCAIRELGKNIKVTHIHDNDIYTDSHTLPMFGKANWFDIMNALNEIEYDGVFSMELNIGGRVGKYKKELVYDMAEFAYKIANVLIKEIVE